MSQGDSREPPSILLVERDPAASATLLGQLDADGYAARLARTAAHACSLAREHAPDLVILGAIEPARAALELLVEMRAPTRAGAQRWPRPRLASPPAIVLGGEACEADLLRAFDAGADDFLAAPVSYLELRARVRALLLRTRIDPCQPTVRVGSLTIDITARSVTLDGRPLALRRLEYELLLALAREPQRVIARHELMRRVWGELPAGSTRTLDSHASRLRRTLCAAGAERWIVNVRGIGYRLN